MVTPKEEVFWGSDRFPMNLYNPRVFQCSTGEEGRHPADCQLFHRQLTQDGIGYSFNSPDFEDRYVTGHPYMQLLRERLNLRSRRHNLTLIHPDPSGPAKYVEFFVHAPDTWVDNPLDDKFFVTKPVFFSEDFTPKIGEVRLEVHDPAHTADPANNGLQLVTGYHHDVVHVWAQVTNASDDLRSLDPHTRNCRFSDESEELTWHKVYQHA